MELKDIQELYDRKRRALTAPFIAPVADAFSSILLNEKVPLDIINGKTGELIIPANRKITKVLLRKLAEAFGYIELDPSPIRTKLCEIIQNFESKFAKELSAIEDERAALVKQTPAYHSLVALENRADAGDVRAQYELGLSYLSGGAFGKDQLKAVELFKKAATQGHIEALVSLADCSGDSPEAIELYERSAAQGSTEALVKIGDCYVHGRGVEAKSYKKAAEYYSEAAEQGNSDAQYKLASLLSEYRQYVCKHGDPRRLALKWHYEAARQGHAKAQVVLGDCWSNGRQCHFNLLAYASGFNEADNAVLLCDTDSAADEQYWTGHSFIRGFCQTCGRSTATVQELRLACNRTPPHERTGVSHEGDAESQLAETEDHAEAAKWYRMAAENGDAEGQLKLGNCYADGWVAVNNRREATNVYRNRQALRWYRKAAEQGQAYAMMRMAECYLEGLGVKQNEAEAAGWRRKAINHGWR